MLLLILLLNYEVCVGYSRILMFQLLLELHFTMTIRVLFKLLIMMDFMSVSSILRFIADFVPYHLEVRHLNLHSIFFDQSDDNFTKFLPSC